MIAVDTSAIIAILESEPEEAHFLGLIATDGAPRLSSVSLLEAGLVARGRRGDAGVKRLEALLVALKFTVTPFDEVQARLAIDAFGKYGKGMGTAAKLNMGDCASYALAKTLGVPLLFKGNDFTATDITPAT